MSSLSPTKQPSNPSRSSSQLSLDSHLSSPRKRYSKSPQAGSSHHKSPDHSTITSNGQAGGKRLSYSEYEQGRERSQGSDNHPPGLSPHLRMVSSFAANVGIGSPKLDFGRREWVGPHRREESVGPEPSPKSDSTHTFESRGEKGRGKTGERDLIDKVSGLPSPPGTESDIAPPGEVKADPEVDTMSRGDRTQASPTPRSPRSFRRSSSTGSSHLLARKPSSHSSSSTHMPESPRLRTHALRPKHTPSPTKHSPSLSMSRSGSSSSSLVTSPLAGAKVNGSLSGSTRGSSLALSRTSSHSSTRSLGGQPGSFPRKTSLPPLNTQRANSSSSQFSSPERTAKKLPPVSAGLEQLVERKAARRLSRDSEVEVLAEEDTEDASMSRSRSNGSELDDKIREAEERIAEASHHRRRRSVDIEQKSTPVRNAIWRHDSYTRATGSPLVASTSSGLRKSVTLSSVSVSAHPDSPAGSMSKRGSVDYQAPEDEERERSGGSASSKKRKGLPENFRNSGLFTPSPQKPFGKGDGEQTGSTRSARLRQLIDSPNDHSSSSPLPSRFSTNSYRSGEYQQPVSSPSRANRYIDGLERSASMIGIRSGETSGYARRNWSQSISGLPRPSDDADHRGLPRDRDRFRAESALGGNRDRSDYAPRASLDSSLNDRGSGRRSMGILASERDLPSAPRSRFGSIAPGDSVSAVGSKNDRAESKDPLEVIRRLEEQRAQSKKRWDHMPRPATSMSSLRESYDNPPNTAPPLAGLRHRRSMDQDSPLSPTFARGSIGSRAGYRGPATEPRPMRSSTSLGGRSSATLDFGSATTEHGRLLFEAFRLLDSKLGQDILATQPELLRTFHSATRSSETINTSLRSALHLASQIAVDAELDGPARVREEYSNLAFLLRDAGKASEQNVRDMTRILLDLPKLLRQLQQPQQQGPGSGMAASASGGSGRLRRSESASLAYDPVKPGVMSEDRARRWQPTSPSMPLDRSPLQGRRSMDTPRRSYDALRASTSIGEAYSPLSRYSREKEREGEKSGFTMESRSGSTVSALMSKVRAMTPRKSMPSPKLDLSTIEASPPQLPPLAESKSSKSIGNRSPEREKERPRLPNLLKKKTSSLSTHTIKGSNFLPSTSAGKATTAISQITAGDLDLSPNAASGANVSGVMADIVPDEPNSPMSRFSFRSQRSRRTSHVRHTSGEDGSDHDQEHGHEHEHGDYMDGGDQSEGEESGRASYDTDAISLLEQRLVAVQAAKARDGDGSKDRVGLGIESEQGYREAQGELKRPSITDRFRALRKG